jgi:hypothetical protein
MELRGKVLRVAVRQVVAVVVVVALQRLALTPRLVTRAVMVVQVFPRQLPAHQLHAPVVVVVVETQRYLLVGLAVVALGVAFLLLRLLGPLTLVGAAVVVAASLVVLAATVLTVVPVLLFFQSPYRQS